MTTMLPPRLRTDWLVRRLALSLAALLWSCAALGAPSRIVEQAFVSDPEGNMTLEQAMQQPQTVYTGALVRLGHSSVVWIRLRVVPDPAAASAAALATTELLQVIPLWSQSLALYDSLQRNTQGRLAGLESPPGAPLFTVHALTIPVGAQPRDLWLRLEPSGPTYLKAAVLMTDAAAARVMSETMLQGVVIGLYIMMILLGVMAWVMNREGIGHTMFTKQIFNLLIAALNANLLLPVLPASWPQDSANYAVECLRLCNMGVSLWFFIRVLELLHAPRWVQHLQRLPLAVMACCIGMMVIGNIALVRTMVIALYIAVPTWMIVSGLFCAREPLQPRTALGLARRGAERAGFGLVLAAAWVASVPSGVFKTQELAFLGPWLPIVTFGATGLLAMVGWWHIRADRLRRMEQAHRAELNALALGFERGERQRQQEFMGMLTHELKAPLSTLGMVIGAATPSASMRRHAALALASMRQVIDHCAQSAHIDDASAAPQQVACSLAVELELRCDALAAKGRIVVAPMDAMPPLLADPRMLAIIFNNLLGNAIAYSPPGSPVSVALVRQRNPEGAVQELRVSNQALVGPLPDASRLFQKYYRGDAAQRVSGSGLGLHLSRLLARRMGGDLHYQADARLVTLTLLMPESQPMPVALL